MSNAGGGRPQGLVQDLKPLAEFSNRRMTFQFLYLRLHIRHGRTLRLREGELRVQPERAQKQIRQRQHHIEIFLHVTMMQQMMPVQPVENSRTLHMPLLRQMHAPVHVFVSREIHSAGHRRAAENAPLVREERPD